MVVHIPTEVEELDLNFRICFTSIIIMHFEFELKSKAFVIATVIGSNERSTDYFNYSSL